MSLNELYWNISWPMLLRIISDLPNQTYKGDPEDEEGKPKSKKVSKVLTEQTSSEFAKHIQSLNEKNKRK